MIRQIYAEDLAMESADCYLTLDFNLDRAEDNLPDAVNDRPDFLKAEECRDHQVYNKGNRRDEKQLAAERQNTTVVDAKRIDGDHDETSYYAEASDRHDPYHPAPEWSVKQLMVTQQHNDR